MENGKPPKFTGPKGFLASINVDYVTWLEHRVQTFETIMKERDDLKQKSDDLKEQEDYYGNVLNESRSIIFWHEGHVMDGEDVPDAIRVLYRRDIQLQGNKAENKEFRSEVQEILQYTKNLDDNRPTEHDPDGIHEFPPTDFAACYIRLREHVTNILKNKK